MCECFVCIFVTCLCLVPVETRKDIGLTDSDTPEEGKIQITLKMNRTRCANAHLES